MFRVLYVGGMVAALCIILISCEAGQPTQPQSTLSEKSLTLSIVQLDSSIFADEGELYPVAFSVSATDSAGLPQAGVLLALTIASGPGYAAPSSGLTDSLGIVEALFYLTVPPCDTTTVIKAVSSADTASATIHIRGKLIPGAVEMTALPAAYQKHSGQSKRGWIRTRVIDRRGVGIREVKVVYTIIEGNVILHGPALTDVDGVIETDLTVDGDWTGDLVISATVRHSAIKREPASYSEPPAWLTSLGWIPWYNSRISKSSSRAGIIECRVVIPVQEKFTTDETD